MADDSPIDPAQPRAPSAITARRRESSSDKTIDVEHPNTVSEDKTEDQPPNGGYGWVCVACNFWINGHTWGINSTYGVFLGYYLSNNFFPGTSALDYAFIGGLSISMAMLIAPLATHVIHLYGTWVCLHIGIFFETLALLGASFSTTKYQIILSQGVCFGWGMGFLFTGSVGIIPQWFTTKRSIANAIAAAGSGCGAMIYSLSASRAIETIGLPWCFRILAICTFIVNLIACNLLKDRNKQTGARHSAFDLGILRRPEFLLIQAWSYFSMLGYVIVVFSLPAYARSIGLSSSQGSILNAILNLGQMIGRPLIGLTSDRFGRINLAAAYTLGAGALIFALWIPAEVAPNPYALLLFFSIVGGALAGTFWTTIAPVAAEVVGLADMPSALSLTWVLMVPPTTVAEAIALELRDQGQRHWVYLPPQLFTAFMYVAGALCLWVLRGWKIGQLEVIERRLAEQGKRHESIQQAIGMKENDASAGSHLDGGVIERLGTQDEVRQSAWETKALLRRMMTWKRV
jgi:MFS family permease